ncbi:hypothetical protein ABZ297_46430, partial [Nonomuraea sp. NPDC005983]|uniref:hypothetical protein n=1 Tax=Nonomuraea sp. NPDC005983 TaxID=3155595 RepID=UPI0033A38720
MAPSDCLQTPERIAPPTSAEAADRPERLPGAAGADSAAGVRVFSDDGKCVSDAVLMRRALEYVK